MTDDDLFRLPFLERLILATEAILLMAEQQFGQVSDPEIALIALAWTDENVPDDDFVRLRDALLDEVGGPLID